MTRHNIAYFIKEGVSSIFSHGFMSFASVSVIITCLLLTGTMSLLVFSLNDTIDSLGSMSDIKAFVDESYTDEQAVALEERLRALPNVSGVDFIDKTRGLAELRTEWGEDAWLLDGLEYDNPLRHSYRIWVEDISKYEATLEAVSGLRGIANVQNSMEAVNRLTQLRSVFSALSVGLLLMMGAVSIFIIANTIKLATFDRREEIAIMKYIGATDGFIRFPFVVESLILSLFAAGAAFGLQYLIYTYMETSGVASLPIIQIADFRALMPYYAAAFGASALLIGMLGSMTSIRRFLKV